jgi:TolB-like protein/tetratricopeptide (TPR) repeat protein
MERVFMKTDLPASAIREQMDVLRQSPAFCGSERLITLLNYVVEETLNGRAGELKEAVIGNAVYQRDPPYDPRIDSTVRVEARRLRKRLEEHGRLYGQTDAISIMIPTGTYVPVFVIKSSADDALDTNGLADRDIFRHGPGAVIAILPFRAVSGNAATQEFADIITDELIFAFGSEPGMNILSRATTFAYKDKHPSIRDLAAELGVDAVIQGTVREHAEIIRVTLEVSDPRGVVITSDRFEGSVDQSATLPERVATTFVSRHRFDTSKLRARKVKPAPAAVQAHGQLYRARQLLDRQVPESLRESLSIFSKIAQDTADYARGHSGIADCYCDMFRIGMVDAATARSFARPAVEKALEIDPQSAEAMTALGVVQAWLERDFAAAEQSFNAAMDYGYHSRTARVFGTYLAARGLQDESERLFNEARRIEPFSQQQDIAEALSRFQSRNFAKLTEAASTVELRNAPMEALFYLALGNHFAGNSEFARLCLPPLGAMMMTHPLLVFAKAELEAWMGSPGRALALLETGSPKASFFAHSTLACSVGDADASLRYLDLAFQHGELSTVWVRMDKRFDALRNHDRFRLLAGTFDAQSALSA